MSERLTLRDLVRPRGPGAGAGRPTAPGTPPPARGDPAAPPGKPRPSGDGPGEAPAPVQVPWSPPRGLRPALFLVGLALIAAALFLWLPEPEPTQTSTSVKTTQTRVAPKTAKAKGRAQRTRSVRRTKTTTVINGQREDGATAEAAGEPGQRSEALFLALLGSGVLLVLAAGTLERINKFTLPGGLGIELSHERSVQIATAVVDRGRSAGVTDPAKLRRAALVGLHLDMAEQRAVLAEPAAGRPLATPSMSEEPARSYWDRIAVAALASAASAPEAEDPEAFSASPDWSGSHEPTYTGAYADFAPHGPREFWNPALIQFFGPAGDGMTLVAGPDYDWQTLEGSHRAAAVVLAHHLGERPEGALIEGFAERLRQESEQTATWSLEAREIQSFVDEFVPSDDATES